MLYAGLDLSRKRLDVHILDEDGRTVEVTAVSPDAAGLRRLAAHVLHFGHEVYGAIESMTGARFVHDTLERYGWDVAIADAAKVKGIAPLAAKTDKIDAWVLAELARRDLVPEIWLPTPEVRAERERARFRLHLVHHRTALKNRIHATLMTFGHPVPVADLFGAGGRELLARLALPGMPTIATATSGPSGAWAVSVARRSPGSTSLASSPKPSGTSSPRMNRLPRQAPRCFWSLDDPLWNWAAGAASYVTLSFSQKAIER